jgi:hypothetical protein
VSEADGLDMSFFMSGEGSIKYSVNLAYTYLSGLSEPGDVDSEPIYLHHGQDTKSNTPKKNILQLLISLISGIDIWRQKTRRGGGEGAFTT